MANNLFTYATKELSQDAFICWLCSFALESEKCEGGDDALRECALKLLSEFVGADEKNDIKLLKISRQYKNIDVLLHIKHRDENKEIIVEDKVHSSEHDDQLQRYKKELSNEYAPENIICVYYKTGFQSDYSKLKAAGYKIFDRKRILDLLGQYIDNINNNIFRDYYSYWKNYDNIASSYKTTKLNEWNEGSQVNSFYDEMQGIISERDDCWAGYGWVNNRGGGFWGFWYGINDAGIVRTDKCLAALYLQLEISWNYDTKRYDMNLCLKLETKDEEDKKEDENKKEEKDKKIRELRDDIINLMDSYGFDKPSRKGFGKTMTVGVYKIECETDEELKEILVQALDERLVKIICNTKNSTI